MNRVEFLAKLFGPIAVASAVVTGKAVAEPSRKWWILVGTYPLCPDCNHAMRSTGPLFGGEYTEAHSWDCPQKHRNGRIFRLEPPMAEEL